MTQNPILKVLSTLCSHEVRYLLMGGQACVFYGGAEFSRDTDVADVLRRHREMKATPTRSASRGLHVVARTAGAVPWCGNPSALPSGAGVKLGSTIRRKYSQSARGIG